MKKKITTLFLLALGVSGVYAQNDPIGMGVGTALVPNKSAILDIAATKKGVLIPRVPLAADKLNEFGLEGDSKTESMLIFNDKGTAARGFYYWTTVKIKDDKGVEITRQQWELITSETVLNQKIDEVKKFVKEEINKITNIGKADDLSYLVAFKPDAAGSGTGSFSYLVPGAPDADGNPTYSQVSITLADLISMTETKTFVKAETHDVTSSVDGTVTKDVVKAYYYFSEEAINAWVKAGNDIKDIHDETKGIPFSAGYKIDVVGAVSGNLEQVFNDNRKFIDKFITKSNGNVYAKVDATTKEVKLFYTDENGAEKEINFNSIETKTDIKKGIIDATGKESGYVDATLDPATVKPGQVIFKYTGEQIEDEATGKRKEYILNITEEVKNSIKHETVREELTKYLSKGGNVYFGDHDGDASTPDLLYRIVEDPKDPTKTVNIPIDLGEHIIKEITNNEKVTEVIKEKLKEVIENNKVTETGEVIDGFKVFKTIVSGTVDQGTTSDNEKVDYNTMFNSAFELQKFSRLLNVEILDKDGQVVLTTVTDVAVTDKTTATAKVSFRFGVGKMYAPLASGKSYDVIIRYISNEKFEPQFPKQP